MDTAQPRFLKWSLIFAITIVANLFVNYALSLAYKAPAWGDFCQEKQVVEAVTTKEACVAQGGQWNANMYQDYQYNMPTKPVPAGYCDVNYTCNKEYSDANSAYNRNVFIILVVVGVILIGCGFFIGANSVLKTALSFSGSFSLIIASIRYWSEAHDWLKVLILGIALAALIALAIKKFSERVRS